MPGTTDADRETVELEAGPVELRSALTPREVELEDEGPTLGEILRATAAVVGTFVALASAAVMLGVPLPFPALGPLAPVDAFAGGIVLAMGPIGFHAAREAKRVRQIEDRFPDFLRDMAANRRAGVPLAEAVEGAADSDYGALTPEIQTMADQLSWNVPFEEVLERFADRLDTPLVQRAVTLILEANYTGGRITDVLEAVSRDVRALRTLANERRSTMQMYTVVVYMAFFVFISVAAMLYTQFLPGILEAGEAAGELGADVFSTSTVTLEDYRQFFSIAAIVQGVGSGILAGAFAGGDYRSGLPHATIMVAIAGGLFGFFAL